LFLKISDLVEETLKTRSKKEKIPAGEKVYIVPDDLYKIEIELGQELLDEEFIKMNEQTASIKDIIQEI